MFETDRLTVRRFEVGDARCVVLRRQEPRAASDVARGSGRPRSREHGFSRVESFGKKLSTPPR